MMDTVEQAPTDLSTDTILAQLRHHLLTTKQADRLVPRLDAIAAAQEQKELGETRKVRHEAKLSVLQGAQQQEEDLFIAYDHLELWSIGIEWAEQHWDKDERHRIVCEIGTVILHQIGLTAEGFQMAVSNLMEKHESTTWQAFHDPLTGLLNRAGLHNRLEHLLVRAKYSNRLLALCLIDLNDFKPINDQYGHEAGDQVLKEIARRMEGQVRKDDLVARLGGDEFLVVLESLQSVERCERVVDQLVRAIGAPIALPGVPVAQRVQPSIGVVVYPLSAAEDMEGLLNEADRAMYSAKEQKHRPGQSRWLLYDAKRDDTKEKRRKAQKLFQSGTIHSYYQPIVSLQDGTIVAVEALARIANSDGKIHGPSEFTAFMNRSEEQLLTATMIEYAVYDLIALEDETGYALGASINVRPDMATTEFCKNLVMAVLSERKFAPTRLTLEIVEDAQFGNRRQAYRALSGLRDMGLRIAIDDIGIGYASLSRFKEMPIDEIKLDQSFVRDLLDKPSGLSFVSALRDLAQDMQVQFVAEGVEHPDILDALAVMGIPYGQGFAIAKPMPYRDLRGWILEWEARKGQMFPAGKSHFGMYAYHNSITKGIKRVLMQKNLSILNPRTLADTTSCPICTAELQDPSIHSAHQQWHRAIGELAASVVDGDVPDWEAFEAVDQAFSAELAIGQPWTGKVENGQNG
jgi:diguanylate cyclase (GGDEF)-like protein